MKKLQNSISITLISLLLQCITSFSQSNINLSKYKIDEFSKSSKFNCTAFRITIPIDLNNDGSIDFVTTGDDMGPCGTNGEISYLKFFVNDGAENFSDLTKSFSSDSLWVIRPNWFLVEDFNNDNKKDIFITGEQIHASWDKKYLNVYPFLKPNIDIDTTNNFSFVQRRHHLYLSQKDGTYKDSPEFLRGMRLGSTFGITAMDYNKDGYVDLINTVQQFSNDDQNYPSGWDVEIFLNHKGEYLNRTTPFTVRNLLDQNNNPFNKSRIDSLNGCVEGPENIKFFDVNGDNYYDMIFSDRSGNSLCMLSQNKYLDLYSPIIKFDDFATNDLLTGMPGSAIGVRGYYIADLQKNGSTQLIAHWANGGGDYQPGKKLYQLIKVFDIKDKTIVDVTSKYFEGKSNIGISYGCALLELIDIDNDGLIDLFPKCFDQDGMGNQGFNFIDSTVYFKNLNGKFKLVSLGLKYYFKEFKEMADSMKVYKYDTIHKFSIANNLLPINTGKSNKLIFYSFSTEPGIDGYFLSQYPNKYFLNTKNKVYNDSLRNYFTGFVLKPNCDYLSGKFKEGNIMPLCSNEIKLISSIDTFPNVKYQWYYNSNKTENTTSKFTASKGGYYTLLLTDENNCSKLSDTIRVIIKNPPNKPSFNTSKFSFCVGDSLKLSITDFNKGDSFKWYFGSNADLTNVASKTFRDSVKLFVIRTDSIGCSASSDTIQLILHSKPAKPTTIASSVCEGGAVSALTATASTGNSLRWYGTSATGGTASASAPTVSSSTAGVTNYYVSQVSAQGCESERGLLKHTVNPLPAKPVISWSGVQFSTTAAGVNYQWLLNGTSISGATASTHKPLNTGDFKLRVTDPNGCVNVSDSFKLVVTALANLATTPASNIATVYPNPASDKVVLEFATLPTINLNFQLVTPSGKVLSSTTGRNRVNIVDVSKVKSGNYFIRVIGKKYDQVKKVLIQK